MTRHHGNRCTRHPDDPRRSGRCDTCQRLAVQRYQAKCREQIRRYRAIEAALTD